MVGAGIEGSNAARYSALLGKNTLCLEQFPIPHDRGSSHGQSRITRHSHGEAHLARMMPEAFKLWEEIEQLANTQLFVNCGYLEMDDYPYNAHKVILENFEKNGVPSEVVGSKQLKENYHFDFPESVRGLLEKTGGILLASKCLRAVQDQFVKFGGILHDNEKVLEITPGDVVLVKTNKGLYKAKNLILTPGPWAPTVLKSIGVDLPLRPKHITVCYWKVKKNGFDAKDNYPTWYSKIQSSSRGHQGYIYSTPCLEYPDLLKVCYHDGPEVQPESRDQVDVTWTVDAAAEFVGRHLPGVESQPSIVETCMYTLTPDRTCVLDRHPRFSNIILGVGFSGSGFKLSPVYGKILCELAFNLKQSYDLQEFRLDRFENHLVKSLL